jgi:DNA-binding response OmpR family regulator
MRYTGAVKPEEIKSLPEALERIRQLESVIGLDARMPRALRLTNAEDDIVAMIAKRAPNCMDLTKMHYAIYGARIEAPDVKIIQVQITKIRPKLLNHGIALETWWGRGYSMSLTDLDKLKSLYAIGEANPFVDDVIR